MLNVVSFGNPLSTRIVGKKGITMLHYKEAKFLKET